MIFLRCRLGSKYINYSLKQAIEGGEVYMRLSPDARKAYCEEWIIVFGYAFDIVDEEGYIVEKQMRYDVCDKFDRKVLAFGMTLEQLERYFCELYEDLKEDD